ncbi:response regulator [Anabaena subtropica]|uniref:histidine kinase n=1 Tax=Anabaena subtropica FACHB-260 TaxID=2692884 RepID=A0ABR8CLC0_9NOST|nr:response regulator [Anabaena subtropica]MBD2343109.1 response regulator [Anabaena subtropica FACHB-260]
MRILLVEDDELIGELLVKSLTHQHYTVDFAKDGQEGWDLADLYTYDLILLDLILPKLDGLSFCRRLRASGNQTPILLLTSQDTSIIKVTGLDAGADDYVAKPFDFQELLARIRALLRRGGSALPPLLEWNNLRLDPSTCEVTCDEKLLHLTPKEYGLLELFLRNSHRIFSCSALIDHLWSFEEPPTEDTVRSHIKGLRQKLKAAGVTEDPIDTVYGIGYRLKPVQTAGEEEASNTEKVVTASVVNQVEDGITKAWEEVVEKIEERVTVIEQASTKLLQSKVTEEMQSQAKLEAHKLAGSLGMFGSDEGSRVAQEIESLLEKGKTLKPATKKHLGQLVKALRQELESLKSGYKAELLAVDKQSVATGTRVMVVDDDPQILTAIQTFLVPWGIEVYTFDSSRQILAAMAVTEPELLILDMEMDGISGIELCQLIRQEKQWTGLPILFLTTHNDTVTRHQIFAAGADDYINKPIVEPELRARILHRLERTHPLQNQAAIDVSTSPKLPVTGSIGKITDIKADQTAAEELLHLSQALESAVEGIAQLDTQGRYIKVNPAYAKITGYEPEEMIGMEWQLTLHPDDLEKMMAAYQQMLIKGKVEIEARAMRKDGTAFDKQVVMVTAHNQQQQFIGHYCFMKDISDRREVERLKDEFVSVVSHELRTPLTSISGALDLLASGVLLAGSEDAQRMLNIAAKNTDRLVRLINDILDIERIESGKIQITPQACNAADLMTQSVEVMEEMAEQAGVEIAISPLSANLWADPDRIIQVFTNLLSNAIKFSPPGSTVCLTAEIPARGEDKKPYTPMILFQVKDQGRGIPPDKLESIFERFGQVDASDSRKKGGTGLGLAICRSILQHHGGQIWANSTLGEGSTFSFTLPILPEEHQEKDDFLHLPYTLPQYSTNSTPPLILHCDDDPSVRSVVQVMLERQGYRVMTVASGQEAVEQATLNQPDAIILNLMMPEMDGWETLALLKQQSETKNVPVIILSGVSPDGTKELPNNVSDWIIKPPDIRLLCHALEKATAKQQAIKVLVVEDDPDLAQVLIAMFNRHGTTTFYAQTGREAIQVSQDIIPDLLVLDLGLPECDGFAVVDWLRQYQRLSHVPLVVYTARDVDESDRQRLKLGQTLFLTKGRINPQEFEQRVISLLNRMIRT